MLTLEIPDSLRCGAQRIRYASVDDDWITLVLATGRCHRLPTAFSTPLLLASERERRDWRVSATGRTIRWRSLGVVLGLKRGRPRSSS
jgi:hypothetical protein